VFYAEIVANITTQNIKTEDETKCCTSLYATKHKQHHKTNY